jgi:TonB-linked SusC/RagA family outer membrane protein
MAIHKYLTLTFLLLTSLSPHALAGEKGNEKNLKWLIRKIERESEYLFVYNDRIDTSIRVKVIDGETNVLKILDAALAPTCIDYRIEGNYISLRVKPRPPAPPSVPSVPAAQPRPGIEPAIETIEDVVVVGMGRQRRISVIGAVSSVDTRGIKTSDRALSNSLAGRFAGVVGIQPGGEPGHDYSEFWIRGISTFGTNRTPLVLVDGVERAGAMDNISIEEIESISILKDASATAVYGARAANGVVVIETKKGIPSLKTAVEVKMEYGLTRLTRLPEILGGVDYMTLSNRALGCEEFSAHDFDMTRTQRDPMLYPDVNWMGEIFKKNSGNKNISATVRGGGERARYFFALGVMDEHGNYRDDPVDDYKSNIGFKRYNLRSNVGVSLTPTTTLDVELGGYITDGHYPLATPGEIFHHIYRATPVAHPVKYPLRDDANGRLEHVWATSSSSTGTNPLQLMRGGTTTESHNQYLGQVRLTHDFDRWVEGLSANVAVAVDSRLENHVMQWRWEPAYTVLGRDDEGELQLSMLSKGEPYQNFRRSMAGERVSEFKAQVNYERIFALRHRFGAMAIYYQRDRRDISASDAVGEIPYRKQGVAFRTTYSWDSRYFAEFNLGYNGSENFRKDERFGIFPAGALGWIVSNEKFWRDGAIARIIPSLKLRGSIGLVGSEALPDGRRFAYLSTVRETDGYHFGPDGVWMPGVDENHPGVQHLTWEKGFKRNFGVELRLPRGIASLQFDLFHETRTDILVERVTVPDLIGVNVSPLANMGKMENRGVEGSIDIDHTLGELHFRVYANATFNSNKVLEMDEETRPYEYLNRTGRMLDPVFGLIALGYFTDQEDVDNSPRQCVGDYGVGDIKYRDVNGDNVVDFNDMVQIGYSGVPQLTYGFGVQLDWRGFDVGLFFRGRGRVSYTLGGPGVVPILVGRQSNEGNLLKKALDSWSPENPRQDAFYPNLGYSSTANNFISSTKWLVNGNLLRLADMEIGYTLPRRWVTRTGVGDVRIYFHGTNLALMAKFKLWDPEACSGNGSTYPLSKRYNLGLKLNF